MKSLAGRMWSGGPSSLERQPTHDDAPRTGLHNIDESKRKSEVPEDVLGSDSTRVTSPNNVSRASRPESGLWGERDIGGPVNRTMAMEDYEQLRKELTNLSQTRSKSSLRGENAPVKTISRKSSKSKMEAPRRVTTNRSLTTTDTEAGEFEKAEDEEEFPLDEFMRQGNLEKRAGDRSAKRIGVLFKDLTVKGIGTTSNFVKTVPDAVMGTFGPDLYHLLCRFIPFLSFGRRGPVRTLVNGFSGVVRDGEMMLVLGRPGAGCSTFLKALANNREGFAEVTGDVSYGGIDATTQQKYYRGEVIYNPEDDLHFPDLNVFQTLILALLTKTKKRDRGEIPVIAESLMKMFGIPHTRYTKVGNEFVPGVSGGERKRVSIAETLAAKSTVLCWDNSTRGCK